MNKDPSCSSEGQLRLVNVDAACSFLSSSTSHSNEATSENDAHGVEQNNSIIPSEQRIDGAVHKRKLGDYATQTAPKKLDTTATIILVGLRGTQTQVSAVKTVNKQTQCAAKTADKQIQLTV